MPRCQIGNLFKNSGFFVFTEILEMPDKCSHCKQGFKIEPGFYSAALWISYPIVLITFIPLVILGFSLDSINGVFRYVYPLIVLFIFFLQIPIMRISRAVLLNMTIDYTTKW